jgi:hypothetical protein
VRTAEPLVLVIVLVFEATEEVSAMTVLFELNDMLVVIGPVEFDVDVGT